MGDCGFKGSSSGGLILRVRNQSDFYVNILSNTTVSNSVRTKLIAPLVSCLIVCIHNWCVRTLKVLFEYAYPTCFVLMLPVV